MKTKLKITQVNGSNPFRLLWTNGTQGALNNDYKSIMLFQSIFHRNRITMFILIFMGNEGQRKTEHILKTWSTLCPLVVIKCYYIICSFYKIL